MRFSDSSTARVYSDRDVDPSWIDWCRNTLDTRGKVIVDIGCGGGIYSNGFLRCGAKMVYGIDSSAQYVNEAKDPTPMPHLKSLNVIKRALSRGWPTLFSKELSFTI